MFLGASWPAEWGFDEFVGDRSRCGGLPPQEKSITVSGSDKKNQNPTAHNRVAFSSWWTTGAQICCRLRSPTPWASAAPPATPTRCPVARCPLMTTTPRWWASGELHRTAWTVSKLSASRDSTVWWGRWPTGTESLELKAGGPKVNFSVKSEQSRVELWNDGTNPCFLLRDHIRGARKHLGDVAHYAETNTQGSAVHR